MRITFVLPPDSLSGTHRVLAAYTRNLAARGHEVTLVRPRHPRPSCGEIARSLLQRRQWPRTRDPGSLSFFEGIPARQITLPHAGPVTDADVPNGDLVIATWWATAEWVWALPGSKGMKVHFMQDYEIWGGDVDRVDAVCRLPIPKIVVTRWISNLLHSRFGQEAITIVPNSVDTALFRAPPRSRQQVPTVGFTYSTLATKGTDVAIAAIDMARRELPHLRVIAFGAAGPSPRLPLPPRTEFFRHVPDRELPPLYAACDAWLFGSRIEGFGLPILEAMACRTPVIATPAGAAPDLLSHGGGLPVPMENPQAMAAAIVRLARMSPSAWRELSDAALATAATYTWEDATDAFETALQEIRTGTLSRELERVHAAPRKAGVG